MRIVLATLIVLLIVAAVRIHSQAQVINALIELNHDKSVYIDAGCRGEYQGTEEMLPSEVKLR